LIQCQELKEENKATLLAEPDVGSGGSGPPPSDCEFVNRRLSCKDSVDAIKDKHDITLTDYSDKTELVNKYLGSVCTVDDGKLPKVDYSLPHGSVIDLVTFNTNTVQKAIKRLKSNTASGPDDRPPIMFKHLSGCLAEPLSLMFTSLMSVGETRVLFDCAYH